ncbi:ATP-binding protein [Kordiimonas sp.]|uniref:sensor histidine kinase n=1 Tax=Kordiimonas sp. TaxID=1970157 RepID=UPI003A910D1E
MNFRKLVAPVFLAVAVSIAAFGALVVFAAARQDTAALSAEKRVVAHGMASLLDALAVLAEDNAWWDAAVENIFLKEDIDWIDYTLGESVMGINQVHGVLIIRADGTMAYANFTAALPSPHSILDHGLATLVKTTKPPQKHQPLSRSGYLKIDDSLIAFGASMVQSTGANDVGNILGKRLPFVVFISLVSSGDVAQIGRENAIENLRLAEQMPNLDSSFAVMDIQGQEAAFLSWESAAPGSQMIRYMILPAILLLVVIGFAMARFLKRAGRLIEELAGANKAKSAFLASTSHEIRTPLNAIIGFTEMISLELYGKVEGEKNKEYLKLIKDSGEHLLSIINDILDISKLEAERFEVYAERVDPREPIRAACQLVAASAREKDIEVDLTCLPGDVLSDERIMRQILINLLSNAIKFTPLGGKIIVDGKIKGRFYALTVEDTGVGMTDTEIKVALSLFGQVNDSLTRSQKGTGLGLPLVTRFVDLLNGTFNITSTPGVGTRVTVSFPLFEYDPHV